MNIEQRELLDNILEHPEDDALKLIYADYLDDNVKDINCIKCNGKIEVDLRSKTENNKQIFYNKYSNCDVCNGKGTISNLFAEQAEFIRIQCGIVPYDDKKIEQLLGYKDGNLSYYNFKNWEGYSYKILYSSIDKNYITTLFKKGFIEYIYCKVDEWLFYGKNIIRYHPINKIVFSDFIHINNINYFTNKYSICNFSQYNHLSYIDGALPYNIFKNLPGCHVLPQIHSIHYTNVNILYKDVSQAAIEWAKEKIIEPEHLKSDIKSIKYINK